MILPFLASSGVSGFGFRVQRFGSGGGANEPARADLLYGPRWVQFLMSEVPLYICRGFN